MTEDIYAQLNKKKTNKKVPPRSEDGFNPPQRPSLASGTQANIAAVQQESNDLDLVTTAKPKSIAFEVNLRNQLDEYLFHHKQVSWDTFIEAAVHYALTSSEHHSIVEDAANRLAKRKLSSTKRRIKTMTANIYSSE
ncbi:MAG TPA: hypothetical protein V6C71_00085 [Coleofasciculaceae cyanobacterium]|jgi:hypothetical protein